MFNLAKIAPFLIRAVSVIAPAVQTAQTLGQALHTPGADKQAAVVQAAQVELAVAEEIAGKDFVNDADVIAALRSITDAVVNLHKIVEHKVAPPAVV